MGKRRITAFFAGVLVTAAGVTGCSPGSLFGGSSQDSLPTYAPVNTNCENLDLSSPTFNVPAWRVMVKCLNSYGALQPIEALNEKLSDRDLQPVVDAVSKYLLTQPKTLYEIEQSYDSLDSQGQLDPLFENLGTLMRNDQFVSSGVTLLKFAYELDRSSFLGLIKKTSVNQDFLAALRYLAPKMTPDNVATGLDVSLTAVTAPALASLQKRLQTPSPDGRNLEDLTNDVLEYLQDTSPGRVPVGEMALQGLVRGDLFTALDDAIGGATVANLQGGIDRLSSVFRATLGGDGSLMAGITTLFSAMHQPLTCMQGTQTVADGDMFILSQLVQQPDSAVANYMEVSDPLLLISVNPFCDYPPQLAQDYPSMVQFARTSAMVPGADLIRALYRPVITDPSGGTERPLANLFVDMMAEPSVKDVIPVANELTARGVWDDLLLMATIPPVQDRQSISDALKYIDQPIPGAGSAGAPVSVYDVFMDSVRRVNPSDFYGFVSSLNGFVDSNAPVFQPLLQSARDFYYVNDVHPVVSVLQKILKDAPANSGVFDTLFKAAAMPEFGQSIRLMAQMAKDGRLKQLTGVMLALLHRQAESGVTTIHPVTEPEFTPLSRHNLDETSLTSYPLTSTPTDPGDPCANLDLSFGVNQFSDANYNQKLNNTVQCLSKDLGDPSIASTISFLESQTSGIPAPGGGSNLNYFQLPIQLIENMHLTQGEMSYLSDAWLRNYDSGFFLNLLDIVPYFVSQDIGPGAGQGVFAAGPVLQPLFDLAAPLMSDDARPRLDHLENYVAGELKRDDFPKTLGFADKLLSETNEPVSNPPVTDFDKSEIERWVEAKECESATTPDQVSQRADQIVDDFDNSVDNWTVQDGEPRRTFSFDQFQAGLSHVFEKLQDPSLSSPDESLTQAFINILSHFTLAPGQPPNQIQHFHPEDLIQFFKQRSEDYRLLTFYYTDEDGNFEKYPRVKLVNTLDRLELVMIAADFDVSLLGLEVIGNSSLKYGMELALAWGDTPRELWPPRIQAMFPVGGPQPQRIQDVVNEMDSSQAEFEDLIGFPSLPKCAQPPSPSGDPNDPPPWPKNRSGVHLPELGFFYGVERSLFNDNQVLSVMTENSPDSTGPNAGGLKIMREIFYELYFSTLPEDRSITLGSANDWKNNVHVADDISRMGMLRVLGQKLRSFTGNEQDLLDVFRTLTQAGNHPETLQALQALLENGHQPQEAVWTAVQSIFNVLSSAEGIYTPEQQAQLAAMSPEQQQAQKEEWAREAARMKQMGYYMLADSEKLNLTAPMMGALASVVNGYSDFIAEHGDSIESMLRSATTSYAARGLYEEPDPANQQLVSQLLIRALGEKNLVTDGVGLIQSVAQDPTARNSWTLFSDRLEALRALPEYQPYGQYLNTFGNDLVSFFANQTTDPNALSASNHLRAYTASLLTQGDIDQFLLLAKNNPNESYQLLQLVSRYIQNGDLQSFFQLVRESLSQPGPH